LLNIILRCNILSVSKNTKIGIAIGVTILIVIVIGALAYQNKQTQAMVSELTKKMVISTGTNPTPTSSPSMPTKAPNPTTSNPSHVAKDPQNATYSIEGKSVTLINGKSEDGTTTMFGEPTTGDLNGDGAKDAGVILVVSGNGSGTFYYAAAALNNTNTYTYDGTNAIILGDRIAPQTESIQNEIYTVNFAERAPGEPMTTQPSVGVSKYFKVNGTTLQETSN
jgi:hypothetical protein